MAAHSEGVGDWVRTATADDFARRIEADAGFLSACDGDAEGFAVVHHAAASGRNDLIRMALERGVSIDMPSGIPDGDSLGGSAPLRFEPGYSPLMSAAAHGQLATVRYLISAGADPFRTDYYGGTALHSAAASGSVAIVNVLLAAGCDPDAECGYKADCEELGFFWIGTPLHIAAVCDRAAVAATLIGHGATVDALGMLDERRPLHYAAAKGAQNVAAVLLRAGADPSRPEAFHDQTPLHYAVRGGHVDCVALLLRYGADPRARERETGDTALDLAKHFYIPERAEALVHLLNGSA